MIVAVVTNPRSGRNRRHGPAVPREAAERAGALFATLKRGHGFDGTFARFAREGVSLVVIDGGDGTVRRVLGAALAEPGFARPPRFAILPSGTTNMIAGDVGCADRARAFEWLVRLADDGMNDHTVWRSPIRVLRPGLAPEYGFFFGAGVFAWGTRLTRRFIQRGPLGSRVGTVLGAVTAAGLLALGAGPAGQTLGVGYDGGPLDARRRTLFLATTLDRLVAGWHPFWGAGDGPLRVLDVAHPPRRFACALPALARGRPRPWMAASYASRRARRVEIELSEQALFDGEWIPAGPVTLEAAPPIGFVRP